MLRTADAAQGGRHRAPRTPSAFATAAPRVLGVAALALATTGTVSAATMPSAAPSGSQTVELSGAVMSSVGDSDRERPPGAERVLRVSRDASRPAPRPELGRAELGRPDLGQADKAAQLAIKAERTRASKVAARKAAEKKAAAEQAAAEKAAAAERAANSWKLPLAAGGYRLTSRFGECSALWSSCHTGLDFAAPSGTPVVAIASGVVTETAYAGAYGNRTIVTLEDGSELWYCHQTAFAVGAGETVVAGQTIGSVGTTGNTTGAHLHLEVRPAGGDPVDPAEALAAHGVTP